MQDVYRKIEREKVLINGARAMRSSTDNQAVQHRLDNQIRESQRNLEYLEGKYNELQKRVMQQNSRGMENMQVSDSGLSCPDPEVVVAANGVVSRIRRLWGTDDAAE